MGSLPRAKRTVDPVRPVVYRIRYSLSRETWVGVPARFACRILLLGRSFLITRDYLFLRNNHRTLSRVRRNPRVW